MRDAIKNLTLRVIHDGKAVSFYDYLGDTFGNDIEDQKQIDLELAVRIAKTAGYDIVITDEADNNGHCIVWFKPLTDWFPHSTV